MNRAEWAKRMRRPGVGATGVGFIASFGAHSLLTTRSNTGVPLFIDLNGLYHLNSDSEAETL